jgi:hypothetical protein
MSGADLTKASSSSKNQSPLKIQASNHSRRPRLLDLTSHFSFRKFNISPRPQIYFVYIFWERVFVVIPVDPGGCNLLLRCGARFYCSGLPTSVLEVQHQLKGL